MTGSFLFSPSTSSAGVRNFGPAGAPAGDEPAFYKALNNELTKEGAKPGKFKLLLLIDYREYVQQLQGSKKLCIGCFRLDPTKRYLQHSESNSNPDHVLPLEVTFLVSHLAASCKTNQRLQGLYSHFL